MYKVEWQSFTGDMLERVFETEREAYEHYEWLYADEMISCLTVEKVITPEEMEIVEKLKSEVESHFCYYGKEIERGFYKGFEKDADTLDSMIHDLEASLRVLEQIKEIIT